nr:immunity protein YezG family protein [Veillonella denticariosi]
MKKLVVTSLAVLAVVGTVCVQPADAKKVQQEEPVMATIEVPLNDEIRQNNGGASREFNKKTQKLVAKLAESTQLMIKKDWKTIYIKAVLSADKGAVRFYFTDRTGQLYSGQTLKNTGLSKNNYLTGASRQVQDLQNLYTHLKKGGQELPSSIDITVTQSGQRTKTRLNYGEDTTNVMLYYQQYESETFPDVK